MSVQAHLPAAYGLDYLRADAVDAATVDVGEEDNGSADTAIDPAPYLVAVRELELGRGPYAAGLSEPLNALARYHADQDKLRQALALYDRAIHVERVNGGLDSTRLLPLLREQAALYRSLGDTEGLDRAYQQMFRVHGAGRPPYSPTRLQGALEYYAWQREAIALADGRDAESRLVNLLEETQQLLEDYLQDSAADAAGHLQLLRSQLDNLYVLRGLDPDTLVTNLEETGAAGQRLQAWQRIALSRGVDLIKEYPQQWPGGDALTLARLQLELADWYQWNSKWRTAREIYAQLWHWMGTRGLEDEREGWLGQPVELPAGRLFGVRQPAASGPATLQFDVSASGQVRQISLAGGAEDPGYKIRRLLRDCHFRPAFADGEAIATTGLVRSYVELE